MMNQPMEQYKPAEKLELKEIKTESKKKAVKIHCPSCESEVDAANLNLQNSVAKCNDCNVIFSIEDEVNEVKTKAEVKQEILRPEGIDLFYYKDELDITVPQFVQGVDAFGVIFLPLIAIFSLLLFFVKGTITSFVPILSTIGAVYFIYKAFNYSKNKTYIDINKRSISIRHRPKNFRKDKTFDSNEVDQLYIKHAIDRANFFTIYMIINGLEGQKHEKLVTVSSLSKAKYLEQEIEHYLNIEDRQVPDATI